MRSVALITAVLAVVACQNQVVEPLSAEAEAAARVLEHLDALSSNEPDTVLLAARAHTLLAELDPAHEAPARELLEKLTAMTVEPAAAGWGLSFAWDAFADGTVNPASTIYSYTTAAAGLAFLDAFDAFGDVEYLDHATAAAETLLTETCCWSDGDHAAVWYSNQPNDMKPGRQVHNVSALSLAVFDRLEAHGQSVAPEFADKMAAYLLASQGHGWDRPDHAAPSNWAYSVESGRANDLLHETFIIEGFINRPEAAKVVAASVEGILAVHFSVDGHPDDRVHTQGSRGWGPPAGLYLLAAFPEHKERVDAVARVLAGSITEEGTSTLLDGSEVIRHTDAGDRDRALGWYALGLARYASISTS